ncbi:MAG: adenylosuccinate lyase [Chloroflexi bacterium]|nr:adenylosuccinate lyase [Chloroflexota bacterium]
MNRSLRSGYNYDTFLSPFTWRYGSQEMRRLWSEEHKRRLWRRIWVALAEAEHQAGQVSQAELDDLRAHQDEVDMARSLEIEAEIGHDKMAEIRAYAEQCPIGGGKIHLGATSADVEDNADILRLKESLHLIRQRLVGLLEAFAAQIERYQHLPAMGYTHLQPAEPTTLGYRLCQYAQDLLIDLQSLDNLMQNLKAKGLKGAVGTSTSFAQLLHDSGMTPAELERLVMEKLGLEAMPVSTQVYPRKQDFLVLTTLASMAQSLHRFAFDLRVLHAAPFGELSEPFAARQVGSTAMPFKRNPVTAEKICSLARYVSTLPRVAWDNAAFSLLERTLDDSANRRVILPQAFLAVDEMLFAATRVVMGLVVHQENMERNLSTYGVFAATEMLLMELVKAGADRQEIHERIRQHTMVAWVGMEKRGEENPLIERLSSDSALVAFLPAARIRELLDAVSFVGDAPARCAEFLHLLRTRLAEI